MNEWMRVGVALGTPSGDDTRDHLAAVDRGAFVTSVVEEGEFLVIHAKQGEDRGMNVVDVRPAFDRPQTDLIRCAIHRAAFDAAARHPRRESPGVMVAAFAFF